MICILTFSQKQTMHDMQVRLFSHRIKQYRHQHGRLIARASGAVEHGPIYKNKKLKNF